MPILGKENNNENLSNILHQCRAASRYTHADRLRMRRHSASPA